MTRATDAVVIPLFIFMVVRVRGGIVANLILVATRLFFVSFFCFFFFVTTIMYGHAIDKLWRELHLIRSCFRLLSTVIRKFLKLLVFFSLTVIQGQGSQEQNEGQVYVHHNVIDCLCIRHRATDSYQRDIDATDNDNS